ncbi:type II toxin-antitoxin system antitoxin DNA ADP-ribosyl glycohydrolase DarG [Xanthomonas vesicatoria]|uniref:Appr-1-p processing protein n=1 Tax=Xanthomonas vesicatoria TaxID=56460 RepID=A0AAJ0IVG8_9XANT|nr:macro domain-containing protein [Xanthomonas vesicatoria]APO93825.1 Appr-1-p processing protein [Xanthomonas vesicatoria]KHM90807.1 Appr-1-p processing protein [Xanthomonas vesicatoria]KHM91495.1 Appr-1-p processing protein [Xanthomonas vesicatoria]MCC8621260.1 macro domain-containing protein [Xanthomonas vesicatoria]MCC8693195.1 macro domain-containing protein [Xanthomonas vesicatoria]
MINITRGNLLKAKTQALVNTVNTEGVMGKGIALQFKQAFPSMYRDYNSAAKAGGIVLGKMHIVDLGALAEGPQWIINFPTKKHWKSKSRIADIEAGLVDLVATIRRLAIRSIAVPPLGCGYGGLDWTQVKPLIEAAFSELPDVDVQLYSPEGAPEAASMPTRTACPSMTEGRASLLALMRRYQAGLLDPFVSLLEVHKLMYFLQEAGQPLRLQYSEGFYGPYAKNLRQVLIALEGHYISGYGAGEDNPAKPLTLLGKSAELAEAKIAMDPSTSLRMDRVQQLIEGYEDAYGLELLSSLHWVMCRSRKAQTDVEFAIDVVKAWNPRKAKLLKPDHLRIAWRRLHDQKWATESVSAIH